jgi:hypothetical protein
LGQPHAELAFAGSLIGDRFKPYSASLRPRRPGLN